MTLPIVVLSGCRETTDSRGPSEVTFVENKQWLPPHERWGELFEAVQLNGVFEDSKTFVDCIPRFATDEILSAYAAAKDEPGFDLRAFVLENFDLPPEPGTGFTTDTSRSIAQHISALWPVLTREPDVERNGSLIALPNPYVVPGGRFREIYYWDSYFTMLGLQVDGRDDMIEHMVKNFAYLIDTVGFIPNGNRTYYLTRSQPPFFAKMVDVLAESRGTQEVYATYLPQLRREYDWWMEGASELTEAEPAQLHTVRMPDGAVLNRYYDRGDYPRAESYREDIETARASGRDAAEVYRHLRSGAESGWDFSSRWLKDGQNLSSIHTTDIIPVDLNALLFHLEKTLANAYRQAGNEEEAARMDAAAAARRMALINYSWDEKTGLFQDYDFRSGGFTNRLSLAGVFPLFFGMATPAQAARVARTVEAEFLKPGGVVSTPYETGEQWDFPNGWPPLQWVTIQGLRNYGFEELARTIQERYIALNRKVYQNVDKMVEKYNVIDMTLLAGGGEYPVQDGFGWSNGVLLRLLQEAPVPADQ